MTEEEKLIDEIFYCPNCSEKGNCKTIIESQKVHPFQNPEPFTGDIAKSKVLVISSNPSISNQEVYPSKEWTKEAIRDFFINRFNTDNKYVRDYKYVLIDDKNKTYADDWVRYWSSIRNRVAELYGRPVDTVIPGVDYTLTELVHCKSRSEIGVNEALLECTNRYFEKLIEISGAKVIVVVGNLAANFIKNKYNISELVDKDVEIGNRKFDFIFIEHPNSRTNGPKRLVEIPEIESKLPYFNKKLG